MAAPADDRLLRADLLAFLTSRGIAAQTIEHPAAPTVEEHSQYVGHLEAAGAGQAKQLFLRDKKGGFYLVSCLRETAVDLKVLSERLGLKRSEPARMAAYDVMTATLQCAPGSVTPFAVKYATAPVRLLLDAGFRSRATLLFHPMQNTATTIITPADLEKFLAALSRPVEWVDFSLGADAKIPEPGAQQGGGSGAAVAAATDGVANLAVARDAPAPAAAPASAVAAAPAGDAGAGEPPGLSKLWDKAVWGRPCGELRPSPWHETIFTPPAAWQQQ